ncbi:putative 26S proteasome regulatory subunit rpn-6.1 [Ditylenchus destructor]|nr:putative 26S proteasome regulatory subunit rpn-6.1 [Ditylenchus destructor]
MELSSSEPHRDEEKAIKYLTNFVKSTVDDEEGIKKKEESIMELGSMLAKNKRTQELRKMIENARPFLTSLGQAKAAKLVRELVDLCLKIEDNSLNGDIKVDLCKECIQWAEDNNRAFLRQTLQARLVRLLNDLGRYNQSLQQAVALVRELKKVDDKDLIVEVQLEESKACYHLSNLAKARAALTSARTTANSMYIPPRMQAALDMQSGILHAADERDFKTAFSYFYEAFEGYDSVSDNVDALRALKYMLLSKVMLDHPDEVNTILAHKHATKYSGPNIDAMRAVAVAAKKRSLADFNRAFGNYCDELQRDPVVKKHFNSLSDSMLEKDLCRIIEPYSHDKVEKKLSQMILDKKFSGSLHQDDGMLIVYAVEEPDPTYQHAVATIHSLGEVVDALYTRAKKIR